jgi:hypothetical protein
MPEATVEIFDDPCVALHGAHPCLERSDQPIAGLECL